MKKIILGIIAIVIFIFCLFGVATCHGQFEERQENLRIEQELLFEQEIDDVQIPEEWYRQDGYDNVTDWWNNLVETKEKYSNIASEVVAEYGSYLTDEQKQEVEMLSDLIASAHNMNQINGAIWSIEAIEAQAQEAKEEQELQKQMSANASAFKSAGVLYANGYRYTYYSSNQLYHYMTPQWILGADGIYRDNNGYVIVASSTHSQGTTVPTPFGTGIVRDSGCAKNTIDIYTNF